MLFVIVLPHDTKTSKEEVRNLHFVFNTQPLLRDGDIAKDHGVAENRATPPGLYQSS